MRRSIKSKIVFSYFVIIAFTIIIVGALFSFAARGYAERQVRENLKRDAASISQLFQKDFNVENDIAEVKIKQLIKDNEKVRKIVGDLDSSFAIINKDMKVLYPKSQEDVLRFNTQILQNVRGYLSKEKTSDAKVNVDNVEYLTILFPIKGENSAVVRGWVILYAPVIQLNNLTKGITYVLAFSLIFAGFFAVVIGIFIAKSIARPITALMARAERLSRRDFDARVRVDSGDELEDLAKTIDKMAEELKAYDMAQKKFLQNASHELKTPLMSIQGYAEGIKDGVFENNEKALDIIVEESNRLKSIVEDLIFLSKLETMEDFYRFAYESVNETIQKSIEKVNSLAIRDGITIKTTLYKDARIKMDRDKVTQALINVLGNCIRYSKTEITLTASNNGESFVILINDDGEGFEEKEIDFVFERFYKGKKGNTGLGLAITKAVIERHNGKISALNCENGGAGFSIVIPLNKEVSG